MQFSTKGNAYMFAEISQACTPINLSANNLMKGKDKHMFKFFWDYV